MCNEYFHCDKYRQGYDIGWLDGESDAYNKTYQNRDKHDVKSMACFKDGYNSGYEDARNESLSIDDY